MKRIWNDAPEQWQLGFQDSSSKTMEGINLLHDSIIMYVTVLFVLIAWILFVILTQHDHRDNSPGSKVLIPTSGTGWGGSPAGVSHSMAHRPQGGKSWSRQTEPVEKLIFKISHGTVIEFLWTITPAFILVAIAFPSLRLLYLTDSVIDPAITVKVIGHQWYWSTEYSDYGDTISFDSYMIPTEELNSGWLRLLEVDNRIVVPVDTHIRVIVSSGDVIHSFAVPSLGLKIDAMPGRLNQTSFLADREGVFYGQCSELCGIWHGYMPIVIEAVSLEKYLVWLKELT